MTMMTTKTMTMKLSYDSKLRTAIDRLILWDDQSCCMQVSAPAYQYLLEYIYTQMIEDLDDDYVLELLMLSEQVSLECR